ncbi:glutaredoxin-like protein NrdH [Promicromonospora sp. NFX87]|uniref:glutaredoxin-like protein NrdH n=1 Tax=Promicromonospora sp. NFX87 TaxID=3402691 RepID=UPI003AFAB0FC
MKVTVYTKSPCVQCDATKKLLDRIGVDYTPVDLDANPEALAQLKNLGYLGAPVVVTDHDSWAGFQPDKVRQLAEAVAA